MQVNRKHIPILPLMILPLSKKRAKNYKGKRSDTFDTAQLCIIYLPNAYLRIISNTDPSPGKIFIGEFSPRR